MDNRNTQTRLWVVAFIIAVATIFCYWDVRTYEFVNYDDTEYLTMNPKAMQPLSMKSAGWAFTTLYMANWHPLTWISYLMDYSIYGPKPGGYHVTNVLLHALNAVLLFLLLYRMSERFWLAGLVGILYAVHPLHVESVAWVAERKDVLSTFFLILTIFAYYEYGRRRNYLWYIIAIVMFIAGIMAKPMLVTLPFLLLLLDYWPLSRLRIESSKWYSYLTAYFHKENLNLWIEKLPLILISFGAAYVTIIAQKGAGAVSSVSTLSLLDRSLNAIQSYGMYLYKSFVPVNLAVYYPYPKSIALVTVGLWGIGLLTVTAFALAIHNKRPYFITGWLFFLGALVPVIGLIQVGSQAMADRYVYIPHIGLFIAAVFLVGDAGEGVKKFIPVMVFASVCLIGTYMALTVRQVGTWKNNETLYTHAIVITAPDRTAHHNLSAHYIDLGNYELALRHARMAVAIDPTSASSHHNVGLAFEKLAQFDSALVYYKKTLELNPEHSQTFGRLGTIYFAQDMYDLAHELYLKAVKANPNSAINQNNLGAFYLRAGMPERSAQYFNRAIELDPYFNLPYDNLALFMLNIGKYHEAERFLDRSLELNPANPVANKYKGDMYVLRQKYDSALVYFARSFAAQPMNRELHGRITSILNRRDIDSLTERHTPEGELHIHEHAESIVE